MPGLPCPHPILKLIHYSMCLYFTLVPLMRYAIIIFVTIYCLVQSSVEGQMIGDMTCTLWTHVVIRNKFMLLRIFTNTFCYYGLQHLTSVKLIGQGWFISDASLFLKYGATFVCLNNLGTTPVCTNFLNMFARGMLIMDFNSFNICGKISSGPLHFDFFDPSISSRTVSSSEHFFEKLRWQSLVLYY